METGGWTMGSFRQVNGHVKQLKDARFEEISQPPTCFKMSIAYGGAQPKIKIMIIFIQNTAGDDSRRPLFTPFGKSVGSSGKINMNIGEYNFAYIYQL